MHDFDVPEEIGDIGIQLREAKDLLAVAEILWDPEAPGISTRAKQ